MNLTSPGNGGSANRVVAVFEPKGAYEMFQFKLSITSMILMAGFSASALAADKTPAIAQLRCAAPLEAVTQDAIAQSAIFLVEAVTQAKAAPTTAQVVSQTLSNSASNVLV
jgi:hypothetical protein